MSRTTMTAVFAAIIATAAPAAFAQTHATDPRAAVANNTIQPDEIRASKMLGTTVYDVQNRNIGSVKDLVLNKDGKVDAAVVDVGYFSVWAANSSRCRSATSKPTTIG